MKSVTPGPRAATGHPAARTRIDADLEARIQAFSGDSERVELLTRARRFKASWVELAESLSRLLKGGRWRDWGYASFEDYCKKELHLRRETAYKLTGSYAFLKTRAPEVLRRDGVSAPIPSVESVDFWRQAEDSPLAPRARAPLAELEQAVVAEGAPAGALRRKYREVFFPVDQAAKSERDRQALLGTARRLVDLLAETRLVRRALVEDVEEQVGRLVQELEGAGAAATAEAGSRRPPRPQSR